ncbi:MAG: tetratricopeptide repeat protein [Alkalinema sp. CAN_BIN05]|nr:tetratricopeptide repeat protein [Alkalinema sp. CAN_BIN05]
MSHHPMNSETALQLINTWHTNATGECLKDIHCEVFLGCWERLTYTKIAAQTNHDDDYVRELGAELFKKLTVLLQRPVNKSTLKTNVERYLLSLSDPISKDSSSGSPGPIALLDPPSNQQIVDPSFFGRDEEIAQIDRFWKQEKSAIILIHAEGGMGKTRLARRYLELREFRLILTAWMSAESQYIPSAESLVEEWLKRDFNEEVGLDFHTNLQRLRHCLEIAPNPVGILIDNFDAALDGSGHLTGSLRSYLYLLRILSDIGTRHLTLITSRECCQESLITPAVFSLKGLSQQSWQTIFTHHGIEIQGEAGDRTLAEIWRNCGGNVTAMNILKSEIRNRYENNLEAYWQCCDRNLWNEGQMQELVADQFNKLETQQPAAYRLLYRLGSYRYQNPSHITLQGVKALLWDVPEAQKTATIRILQNFALVESRHGEIFWLHPMVHAESHHRLHHTTDWELAHRKAAAFWLTHHQTRIKTFDDTRPTLEAYYHFLEIKDYDQAAEVLMMPLPNLWGGDLALGWILYRFRSLQQIIETAELILSQAEPGIHLGCLYNLLGYTYRHTGEIVRAVRYHREALAIADRQFLPQLRISSLINLGLCHRDCWDIEAAIQEFRDAYDEALKAQSISYKRYAACCLAYLYSGWGDKAIALDYIRHINHYTLSPPENIWGRTYSLVFLGHTYRNLGDPEAALELFHEALTHSEQADFIEIQAKALDGSAQIYRVLGQLDKAIERHTQAIVILDRIDAKCDLAGAYAQRGLTYQKMGNAEQACQDKGTAIGSFRALNLPSQVRWVKDAFQRSIEFRGG